jgi:hypothetical protein
MRRLRENLGSGGRDLDWLVHKESLDKLGLPAWPVHGTDCLTLVQHICATGLRHPASLWMCSAWRSMF